MKEFGVLTLKCGMNYRTTTSLIDIVREGFKGFAKEVSRFRS